MKCPYRKCITNYKNSYSQNITSEDFEECYEKDCPFYYCGAEIITGKEYEGCDKCDAEGGKE